MKISEIQEKLEEIQENGYNLQQISYGIIKNYISELDDITQYISSLFKGVDNVETDVLSKLSVRLSSCLYSVSVYLEYAGLQEDYARLVRKEKYQTELTRAVGRVVNKQGIAVLNSIKETLVQNIAESCYKQIKGRLDYGTELLQSIKKILTLRISSSQIKE